ncbi:MAG: hypothetical protein IT305_10655 [Chloroflexi bacterium]|nr:hypothetical protein [Chloroflexota bacterium]
MSATAPIALGRAVSTPGVAALIANHPGINTGLLNSLRRHARGACPNLTDDDLQENAFSIKRGYRAMTSWQLGRGRDEATIWIITEADRSVTTLLLPSEH